MHNEKCQSKESGFLYKIGMFAAMNKVSVKTLRFYEEQGLLLPSYIDEETNYRYYRLSQMAILHQIQALKQAGFTLEEIMLINSGVDEESIMLRKKAECLEKIAELTKKVAVLDGYLAKKKSSLLSPVLIKEVEQCKVVSVLCQSIVLLIISKLVIRKKILKLNCVKLLRSVRLIWSSCILR